ncbi:glycosyltransferase family 4 protein [Rickettsiales endosymbiont of Stachyamoeba lipophora]|uniref:glycosyltransferase family 4 protein n=1 Tax=Rickettsiales endosymbiont of Stachyamoeba lipophora TaxID=2486578 RepID=UPI000F6520D3|nr:glycosyltransferase family 4 protein [Rickettsiales endosymbiont of Stachyamoeba lipophora]AZL15796.1 glycosyltransferase [Rickettsiales endosymbiont of Stachyamoeba lipophora]
MNILNICSNKWHGGVEQSFIDLSSNLQQLNHEVTSVVYPGAKFIPILSQNSSLNIIQSTFTRRIAALFFLFAVIYFWLLIRKTKANLIIIHNRKLLNIIHLAKTKTTKLIMINHGIKISSKAKKADLVVAVNMLMAQEYINIGINHTFYLPNMVDASPQFYTKTPRSPIILGSFGRFTQEKGFAKLITVAKILNEKNFNFKLLLGGDGEQRETIEVLINKHQLQSKVILSGWVKDKAEFFKQIDIFCLPSTYESFGIVILEAMINSTPVIATNTQGPLSLINNYNNGIIVDKESPASIADSIIKLSSDLQLYQTIANNAYQLVRTNFSTQAYQRKLTQMLQQLSV